MLLEPRHIVIVHWIIGGIRVATASRVLLRESPDTRIITPLPHLVQPGSDKNYRADRRRPLMKWLSLHGRYGSSRLWTTPLPAILLQHLAGFALPLASSRVTDQMRTRRFNRQYSTAGVQHQTSVEAKGVERAP